MPAIPTSLDPWNVSASQLPRGMGATEALRFALKYAVLAPSSHNTQPWRFRVGDGSVEVHADLDRWLRVADPARRELHISCGAAIFHLRLALRCLRFAPTVRLLPGGSEGPLARIEAAPGPGPTPEEDRMLCAVARRRTHRGPFETRAVPESLLGEWARTAAAQGVWLERIGSDDGRGATADLAAEADRIQGANRAYREELAAWMRPNRGEHRDGIPGWALGLGTVASYLAPHVVRSIDWGKWLAARTRRVVLDSPVLLVLGSKDDAPPAWLAAGQALARLLLQARNHDVYASFLGQAVQVPETRIRLTEVLGRRDHPQLLLRMGFGRQPPPTPRRPAGEVQLLAAAYRSAAPGPPLAAR